MLGRCSHSHQCMLLRRHRHRAHNCICYDTDNQTGGGSHEIPVRATHKHAGGSTLHGGTAAGDHTPVAGLRLLVLGRPRCQLHGHALATDISSALHRGPRCKSARRHLTFWWSTPAAPAPPAHCTALHNTFGGQLPRLQYCTSDSRESAPRCACFMQIGRINTPRTCCWPNHVLRSHRRLAVWQSRGCRWGRSVRRCPCSRPDPGGGPTAAVACRGCLCRRRSAQASLCFWAKMSELHEGLKLCVQALSCWMYSQVATAGSQRGLTKQM